MRECARIDATCPVRNDVAESAQLGQRLVKVRGDRAVIGSAQPHLAQSRFISLGAAALQRLQCRKILGYLTLDRLPKPFSYLVG